MKEEKGITIIKLGIILIICIVLITIGISIISDSNNIYNLEKYIAEMSLIQEKINQIRDEYKIWEDYNPNEAGNFNRYLLSLEFTNASGASNLYIDEFNDVIKELNDSNLEYWNSDVDSIITNYYYFEPEKIERFFGIDDSNLYIIINFYTGNVISRDGIKDTKTNKLIHRGYDATNGNKLEINSIYNQDIETKLEIIENRGLKQKIKISLIGDGDINSPNISEIYYFTNKNESTRKKCSMLTDYSYDESEKSAYFTIEVSGEYEFIIEDSNFVQYKSIKKDFKLCNPPVLLDGMRGIYWNGNEEKEIENAYDSNWYNYSSDEFKMANAKTQDGTYLVWIPRFIYRETNEDTDLEFVYDKSNTPTTNMASNSYNLHKAFSENGEITGFWIAKFESSSGEELKIIPNAEIAVIDKAKATQNAEQYMRNDFLYSTLPTTNKLNSIIVLSNSEHIEITPDNERYAGGSLTELGYIDDVKYSSTNNVYGVYDIITSEKELVQESLNNEVGRYRCVLVPNDN